MPLPLDALNDRLARATRGYRLMLGEVRQRNQTGFLSRHNHAGVQ